MLSNIINCQFHQIILNTADEIIHKLFRYCAYQERCRQEVRKKMREWGADPAEYDLIIEYLEEENFLNEARFARAFAGGKFRVKRWGRHKIRNELRKRNIDSRLIERAFIREIPDEAYLNTLEYLMSKRVNFDGDLISLEERQKLFKYLQQKGYEWDLIQAVWKNNKGDNP